MSMRILALDIGLHRTGVAFYDSTMGIPLPLDTIIADSVEEMIAHVRMIVDERGIDRIIVGLPLLLSGAEGSQSVYVRECVEKLRAVAADIVLVDERFTTDGNSPTDNDAKAACTLLEIHLKL